jgi:hypothetical protein
MLTIQEQWKALHQRERETRTAGRWADNKHILKCIASLKPKLQAALQKPADAANVAVVHEVERAFSDHLPFHFYAIPGSQQAAVLADQVYTRWLSFHHFTRRPAEPRLREYRQIIEGVVSNLLYAVAMGRPGIFVTREQSTLATVSRYRPGVYNQTLLTVLDDLHAMKILEQVKGQRWKKHPFQAGTFVHEAMRTRLEPATVLTNLRDTYQTTRPTDVLFRTDQQEVVILKKDESSALQEYTDEAQPKAVQYRQQMQHINRWLAKAGPLLAEPVAHLDDRRRFLVRKFTYGSLESGGRLWGGFWYNMPKAERPRLLRIHGQSTVELDYSSIVAHLAYIVTGDEPPAGDLYSIPGFSPASRPGLKKLLAALFFHTKPATRYPQKVQEGFSQEDQRKPFTLALELIKAQHPRLVPLFGTGIGHFLQYLESQLLIQAVFRCHLAGVVALPLHDCLIVTKDDEAYGREAMRIAGLKLFVREIPVK